MTAAFVLSPSTAFVVGLLSPLAPGNWRGIARTIFNAAQGAIYTSLAALLFNELSALLSRSLLGLLLSALVAALAAVAINTLAVSAAIALERGWSLHKALRQLLWPASHSMVFALVGLLVARMYEDPDLGYFAVIFILSPLVILRAVRRSKLELETARNGTLEMFVRAVESKDPYTSQHSERVAVLATEIYRELGITGPELETRFLGALLHDIGKIGVPRSVLLKPGPLSDEEYEAIKIHPSLGAEAVSEVDYLRGLCPEIQHHHERVDGRGYPHGLNSHSIPLSARVVAVADTFEALTSDRPYRMALTAAEARVEIQAVSGTQLDPDVVAAFGNVMDRGFAFPHVTQQGLGSPRPLEKGEEATR